MMVKIEKEVTMVMCEAIQKALMKVKIEKERMMVIREVI